MRSLLRPALLAACVVVPLASAAPAYATQTAPFIPQGLYTSDYGHRWLWTSELEDGSSYYVYAVSGFEPDGRTWTTWPWWVMEGQAYSGDGGINSAGEWAFDSALKDTCSVGILISGVFAKDGASTSVNWTDVVCNSEDDVLAPAGSAELTASS